jgi:O-antigen ligase
MLLAGVLVVATIVYLPRPQGYDERVSPITGNQKISDDASAISRMHFWRTAVEMAKARPFGVGLWNYAQAYDMFDSSSGQYGRSRAVHNSLLEILAETGFGGFAVYVFLIGWTLKILFKVRARGKDEGLSAEERRIYSSVGTGAIASMTAFLVGGSTISIALNDMTWFTFGAVIALDRLVPAKRPEAALAPATGKEPWLVSST